MASELSHVLDHIEKIRELDLDGVPPTSHVVDAGAPLRADDPIPCLDRDVVLASAPEPVDGGFGVPSPGQQDDSGGLDLASPDGEQRPSPRPA